MSKYESSSSDPESLIEPDRTLRSSQHSLMSPTGSQGSEFATSPPLTPTCVTTLKRFHFSSPKPKPKRRCKFGVRKSKFKGNQWKGRSSPLRSPVPSTPVSSASARKLKFESPLAVKRLEISFHSDVHQDVAASVSEPVGNCIINFQVLQSMFDQMLCGQCATGRISLSDSGTRAGCAHYILLTCDSCNWGKYYWTVSGKFRQKLQVGDKAIAKRNELVYASVLAGRLMGVGLPKLSIYHALFNLVSPLSQPVFTSVQHDIILVAEMIANQSMDQARDELRAYHETALSEPYVKTIVSFDGAYQMRSGKSGGGFSRYCFGAAISVHTAKVVSYGIACNSCKQCNEHRNMRRNGSISEEEYHIWEAIHKPRCTANYSEYASVQLESALAPVVVGDALDRGIIFSGLVTDGDNKTHEVLRKAKLYQHLGIDSIEHLECLSHVAKRLKANLCKRQDKLMKEIRSRKAGAREFYTSELQMGKGEVSKKIDSTFKGKLRKDSRQRLEWGSDTSMAIRTVSEAMAAQIASYYRKAVKTNVGNITAIIHSIKAIPLHLGANDDNAMDNHRFCPHSSESWCRYQAAIFSGEAPPSHPSYLSDEAVQLVQDLFADFGYDKADFVERIQDGRDSNHNEAIHSVLWGMVPKNETASYCNMQLGSALATIRYNDGWNGILKVCDALGITSTHNLSEHMKALDRERIHRAEFIPNSSKKRFTKKQLRPKKVRQQVKKFGEGYFSGKFSGAREHSDPDSHIPSEPDSPQHSVPITCQPSVPITCQPSVPITPQQSQPESSQPSIQVHEAPTASTELEQDACRICGGTEENRLVGIGVQLKMDAGDINWVCCEICEDWYHAECLGIDFEDVRGDNPWFCADCWTYLYINFIIRLYKTLVMNVYNIIE